MSCNLLTRFFRRRTWQSPVPVSAELPNPPALPIHSDKLQLENSLEQLGLEDKPLEEDAFLLGCLYEQGSYVLSLLDIPFGTKNSSIQSLEDLPGFVAFEEGVSEDPIAGVDVFVHFSTASDAAFAMASQPSITLGNGSRREMQYSEQVDEVPERATKRQKTEPTEPLPSCLSCCEELPGPHVRPCLLCNARWCYTCFASNVSVALNDHERFPTKCCGRIIHIDVGKGFLPNDEHARYKTRFEEHSTTKPVYCANVTCSKFLPSRLSKPDKRGRVQCYSCQYVTCSQCKVVVDPADDENHACTVADEITALVKQFDYKRCPRCDAGVAKMFGCSHIRCQCGAHWCWDCQRAIQLCWSQPCERAREDGEMTDDYYVQNEDSDSDDETTAEASAEVIAESATDTPTPAAAALITETGQMVIAPVIPGTQTDATVNNEELQQIDTIVQEVEVESQNFEQPAGQSQHTLPGLNGSSLSIEREALSSESEHDSVVETNENGTSTPMGARAEPLASDGSTEPTSTNTPPTAENDSLPIVEATAVEYHPPAALALTPRASATQPASSIPEPLINLDAEDQDDWQDGDYDFGEEPIDESHDTWGCFHTFTLIQHSSMHEYWMPAKLDPISGRSTKQIDCLRCYKTVTIHEPVTSPENEEEAKKAGAGRKDSGVSVDTQLPDPQRTNETSSTETVGTVIAIVESDLKEKKKRRVKRNGDVPKIFNCARCGIIYCIGCKKAAVKELNVMVKKTVY